MEQHPLRNTKKELDSMKLYRNLRSIGDYFVERLLYVITIPLLTAYLIRSATVFMPRSFIMRYL